MRLFLCVEWFTSKNHRWGDRRMVELEIHRSRHSLIRNTGLVMTDSIDQNSRHCYVGSFVCVGSVVEHGFYLLRRNDSSVKMHCKQELTDEQNDYRNSSVIFDEIARNFALLAFTSPQHQSPTSIFIEESNDYWICHWRGRGLTNFVRESIAQLSSKIQGDRPGIAVLCNYVPMGR